MCLFGLSFFSFAQLSVTADSSATHLAQTLAGSGVSVSSASLNCPAGRASGTFTFTGGALGLSSGIILTNGLATDAANPSSFFASTAWNTTFTDPALTSISSGAINDVCILTFNFVPLCNTVDIRFVFGSEEYPTFVGSINDGFGIFLTGPKPSGGSYTNFDFATLPSGTPITINNVSPSTNSSYYNDNSAGPMSSYLAYDGYVSAITASVAVTPCQTYTMEVAIGDASDNVYDSGVLIQANSVNCTNTPTITTAATPSSCSPTGTASVSVTGYTATPAPTYQWLPGNQTTASISGLIAGTYTCLVGMQTGCGSITQTVTAVVASTSTFSFTTASQNPTCNNGTNGSASVTLSGGSTPYTYTWTSTPVAHTSSVSNLSAGTYTVGMSDNSGCTTYTTIALSNPPAISASMITAPTTCTAAIGSATASCTGLAPYTYVWSNAGTTQTINNLAVGAYSVTVTDANTCTATATGTVSVQGFTWTASAAGTNPLCVGSATGSATVSVANGGANTFTYSWTPSAQTNSVATSLLAGSYTAQVTDNNGCISTASVTLNNPAPLTATVTTAPTICTGSVGSASVSCSGLAPLTYSWVTSPIQTTSVAINLPQGAINVLIVDANNCSVMGTGTVLSTGFSWAPIATTSPTKCFGSSDGTATVSISNAPAINTYTYSWLPSSQTTSVATGFAAQTISVTAIDQNGCVATATAIVTQPTRVNVTAQSAAATCTGATGIAQAFASGGTAPYTYSWTPTTPAQNTTIATHLVTGNYNISITDANGCAASATILVGDTNNLSATTSVNPDMCNKGVGIATAKPTGTAPYTYTWTSSPPQYTQAADSLTSGSYTVFIVDANGCTTSSAAIITNKNDVLNSNLSTSPEGEVWAENQTSLYISHDGNWNITKSFITDSANNTISMNQNPYTYTFPKYGTYTVTAYYISIHGCTDTITYNVLVKDYLTFYIPNAFTPNGDGLNDVFTAEGTFVSNFQMSIYDRWGTLVTTLNSSNPSWNGTKNGGPAPVDTYVYVGSATDMYGKHSSFHGQVTLIR